MTRYLFATAVGAAALALDACGHSPPTRLFVLEPTAPSSAAGNYLGPPVRVSAVHVPPAFDRDEIVTQIAPGELRIEDFDHWAAPLDRIARQTLTENLATRLPKGMVIFPNAPTSTIADAITVDILSLRISGGEASMDVAWTRSTKGVADPLQGTVALRRAVSAPGAVGVADAFSGLLGDLADRIVLDLNARPGGHADSG